ncbi:hypothetical protein ABIB85_008282 [Bradyrhizobium sp. JR1.5]|uniref:hypothetical protein n=1 Tax=unclassified Bradyrhizobium TaxID=2631580 RepID=UPI003394A3B9
MIDPRQKYNAFESLTTGALIELTDGWIAISSFNELRQATSSPRERGKRVLLCTTALKAA